MIRPVNTAAATAILAAMIVATSCVSTSENSVTNSVATSTATHEATASPPRSADAVSGEQVYLLRGFGGIFSLGMDRLAKKLRQKKIAVRVLQHTSWRAAAREIKKAFKANAESGPVVLVGHSLGARAIAPLARNLEQSDIPVDFLVSVDPVGQVTIPKNVKLAMHVRVSGRYTEGLLKAKPGFSGRIVDFDVGKQESLKNANINHFNIDENEGVQEELVKQIVRVVRTWRHL